VRPGLDDASKQEDQRFYADIRRTPVQHFVMRGSFNEFLQETANLFVPHRLFCLPF